MVTKETLTEAIKNKCIECIYDPFWGSDPIIQITECTAKKCPLFDIRPKYSATEFKKIMESGGNFM